MSEALCITIWVLTSIILATSLINAKMGEKFYRDQAKDREDQNEKLRSELRGARNAYLTATLSKPLTPKRRK